MLYSNGAGTQESFLYRISYCENFVFQTKTGPKFVNEELKLVCLHTAVVPGYAVYVRCKFFLDQKEEENYHLLCVFPT